MARVERISCHCNECDILICIASNDWIEVSNSYSTYDRPGAFTEAGLEQVEQIREGSKGSQLEGCLVKPLRCSSCKTALGVRCVKAPVEQGANVNRSYLKLTKMTMKSITSGNLVEAKTKQRQNGVRETRTANASARKLNLSPLTSSKKRSAPERRGSEVEDTEASSSDKVIGSNVDPMAILGEQRKDIERVLTSVNVLQLDMISLKEAVRELQDRRYQASQDVAADVDLLTDSITKVGSSLSELDTLKLEMKMMQQRIKRMEDLRSIGRPSLTVLGSTRVSRRTSPTIDEYVTPPNDGPSNGWLLSGTRQPLSAHLDGLSATRKTASGRHDVVDGSDSPCQRFPSGFEAEALPPQRPFTTRPSTPINGTASRGGQTPINMPPPQTPRRGSEHSLTRGRSSTASNVVTPRTTSTSIKGNTNLTRLPQTGSQTQDASTGSHHNHQEDHTYDDELVSDVRPSTGNSRQPASKSAHSRHTQTNGSPKQPLSKTQRRKSVPMRPPTPKPSNENKRARGRTDDHDSKRRKTTALDANTPSTPIWAVDYREPKPRGDRRDEERPIVRVNGDVHGKSARDQTLERKRGKRKPVRDAEGYLLKPDGTRDPQSVKNLNSWKRQRGEA